MPETPQLKSAAETITRNETVIDGPPIVPPSSPDAAPVETRLAPKPFVGIVQRVVPSTIDPASHVRVWREVAEQIGDERLVILDVSGIAEMDRRAVTAMVQCFKKLERRGVQFCICSPQRQVEAMLELLGILHLVETFGTLEDARANFEADN